MTDLPSRKYRETYSIPMPRLGEQWFRDLAEKAIKMRSEQQQLDEILSRLKALDAPASPTKGR